MSRRRGFSLIESSVAFALLGCVIYAFLSFLPTLTSGHTMVDHRMRAGQMAQSGLEAQKRREPSSFVDGRVTPLSPENLPDGVVLQGNVREWLVPGVPGCYRIRVDVAWQERGAARSEFRESIWCPVAR